MSAAAFALIAVLGFVAVRFPSAMETGWAVPVIAVLILGLPIAFIPRMNRARRKPVVVCVTADGVTVDRRPNDVFSFGDAQLGKWTHWSGPATAALHLRRGFRRLVIGRNDLTTRRFAPGLLPEAPPVAWAQPDLVMDPSDFDELVALVARRRESGLSS
jgi:hypothetical protein